MARLILKSPYIKSTGGASGYLRYIATRERVELIPDDRPPTRKQEQLIAKLVKDFPDSKTLYEYEDYLTKPTKVSASAFITLALESNWDAIHESDQYMKYIATRPRAERIGAHGLFGDENTVSLDKAMEELENYTGNVWTHIISLKREDAARLGFDNAAAWRNLIRAHRNDIAAAMKIPPGDFRWYAAFHDEGEHPHIHMMAWSAKAGQAYLSKEGIRQIKSKLTNDIFRNEMLHLYEQKSESRDELVRQARRAMLELVQTMRDGVCNHPDAEQLMLELAAQLETVKGKPAPLSTQRKIYLKEIKIMTKNTYNPYEIMMDKYDKEEMLSDVREAMLYQLGVDVSCEELNHFFTGKGKATLSGCAEWQQCFAVEKMLEFYYVHARDETLAKQIETMTMLASGGNEHHG